MVLPATGFDDKFLKIYFESGECSLSEFSLQRNKQKIYWY
jgi:hypothetical protein